MKHHKKNTKDEELEAAAREAEEAKEDMTQETDKNDGATDNESSEAKPEKQPSALMQKVMSKAFLMPAAITAVVIALVLSALFQGWIVAATVNGGVVTRHKVVNALEERDGAAALSAFIDEKLIEQEIKKARVEVSNEAIDAEIAALTEQFASVGQSFDDIVAQQGLDQDQVREQIERQLQLESLLADEVAITEEDLDAFIETNSVEIPEDETEAADLRQAVRDTLEQEQLLSAYDALLTQLRAGANITYFVDYANN